MDKTFTVKVTDAAFEQMLAHARFLANVSAEAANRLADAFVAAAGALAQSPERCPWLEHEAIPFQRYRKIRFGKYHMALFEIRDGVVYITAAVDCRQDYGWLLWPPSSE
ncbi:MAG: type II toxin-antitoxin system RelE/ParE family toxin [Oscillospiraceae bacterium]|nr:type II toxin-antitoxin system RelE/ParE family toxin [Oscillospiraceae bacterium]